MVLLCMYGLIMKLLLWIIMYGLIMKTAKTAGPSTKKYRRHRDKGEHMRKISVEAPEERSERKRSSASDVIRNMLLFSHLNSRNERFRSRHAQITLNGKTLRQTAFVSGSSFLAMVITAMHLNLAKAVEIQVFILLLSVILLNPEQFREFFVLVSTNQRWRPVCFWRW